MFDRRIAALLIAALLLSPAYASDINLASVNAAGFAEPDLDDQIHPEIVKADIHRDWTGANRLLGHRRRCQRTVHPAFREDGRNEGTESAGLYRSARSV